MTWTPRIIGHVIVGTGLLVALGSLLVSVGLEYSKGLPTIGFIVNVILPIAGIVLAMLAQGYAAIEETHRLQRQLESSSTTFTDQTGKITSTLDDLANRVDTLDSRLVDRLTTGDVLLETLSLRTDIVDGGDHIAKAQCGRLFTRLRDDLRALKRGHFAEHDPKSFYEFVMTILGLAESEVVATSIVRDEFWTCSHGELYLQQNAAMVRRGITITRYFIFLSSEYKQKEAAFADVVAHQQAVGITVKTVVLDPTKKDQGDAYQDLGIVDDRLAIFDTLDPETGTISKCDCYFKDGSGAAQFGVAKGILIKLDRHVVPNPARLVVP